MTNKLQAVSGAILAALLLAFPLITFAEDGIAGTVTSLSGIVNSLIPLLLTVAVVIFLWGLVKYLFKIGGEEGSKGGLQIMLWGIVGLFVMVSIWGLVQLLQQTLNVDSVRGSDVVNPANLQVTGGAGAGAAAGAGADGPTAAECETDPGIEGC